MIISQMELSHFRNYEHLELTPHEGINICFGPNGSGKTNLLEAIHYCSLGKSHRITQDQNAVQTGYSSALCKIDIQGKYSRNLLEMQLHPKEDSVKTVFIDRKRISRLSEMMGVLRCVIFSPEDLSLIKEGPAVRRKYLDMMISQINRAYFIALQQYRIAVNQRNAILRQAKLENRPVNPMITDFEKSIAERGLLIGRERVRYTQMLSEFGRGIYSDISGNETEDFTIQYLPSFSGQEDDPSSFQRQLLENREDDLRQGITSVGPHRDDLSLTLNHRNMRLFASQGQMRTAALSLKMAQLRIIFQETGDQPVLLLDDVMSELDLKRRMNLLQMIEGVQTFITCTDEGDLAPWQNNRTYRVYSMQGTAQVEMVKQGVFSSHPDLKEPSFL